MQKTQNHWEGNQKTQEGSQKIHYCKWKKHTSQPNEAAGNHERLLKLILWSYARDAKQEFRATLDSGQK